MVAAIVLASFAGTVAVPAFAQVKLGMGVNVAASATVGGMNAGVGAKIRTAFTTTAVNRADQEITRRVDALNKLSARVNAMIRLSAENKASLANTIQSQITAMNNLRAQITADADADATSSLKTDIQSIVKSYRVFMLIIPQGAIEAGADRVLNIAQAFTTFSGVLQTRIAAAQNAGSNMSASVTALADMNAKVADATTQANAAVSGIASLQPDNGNQTVKQANTTALKDARAKLQAAQQDLVAARKDAGTIVKALIALAVSGNVSAGASASTTASGSVQ